VRHGSTFICF